MACFSELLYNSGRFTLTDYREAVRLYSKGHRRIHKRQYSMGTQSDKQDEAGCADERVCELVLSSDGEPTNRCELCNRIQPLTKHHLIPKAVHTKKRYIREYGRQEMRDRGLMACKQCHDGIHDLYTEKELAKGFTTKEVLLEDERVRRHVGWVRKQK